MLGRIGMAIKFSLAERLTSAEAAVGAPRDGARLDSACPVAGFTARALQHWKSQDGWLSGGRRPEAAHPTPSHVLTEQELEAVLQAAIEPRFADMPPARIMPTPAGEGVYLAGGSTFSRVLRAAGRNRHRGRGQAPHAQRSPQTCVTTAPRQVWCWDTTFLPAFCLLRWWSSSSTCP